MAKQQPQWQQNEWPNDGRGQDRLNNGQPAQIQGTRPAGPPPQPGREAQDFYYPDVSRRKRSLLDRLFGATD